MRRAVIGGVLALVACGPVFAAEQPIRGRKLLISDSTGEPIRRKVLLSAREAPASPNAIVGDPTVGGASLRLIATGGTDSEQVFPLPAPGWSARPFGFQFSNALTGGGAVRTLSITRTSAGTFQLKASLAGSQGPLAIVPPNPGDEAAAVLTIAGGDTYCVSFGGAVGGKEGKDDQRAWLVKKPTADACPATPTTTSTTATTSTTTTSPPSTATTTTTTTASTTTSTSSTTTSSTTTASTTTTSTTASTSPSTTTTTTLATTTTTTTTTSTTTTAAPTTTTTVAPTTTTTSTGSTTTATTTTSTTTLLPVTTTTLVVELNFLYVHGLKNCAGDRMNAQSSLDELELAINTSLPERIVAYQAAHPGTIVVAHSARANLYTAPASGFHPSDSPDPLNMDDWEVGDPGCATTQQGDPCTTAYEWRYRLAQEINAKFPPPATNIILVGHSAGGRVAMEVTANLGTAGVGSHDWGVQSRIAGVVSVQGVIDALGSSKYNVVGFTSFESGCKLGDAIMGFGESCAPGNGWCEYAGRVDGFAAADWVATHKRALMLTSWGSCSPSAWTGRSDGSLPYDAQGSPLAVGLDMTPAPGETWRAAHGQNYGAYCHSAIVNAGDANHTAARNAARNRILDWIFVAAPRVAASGTNSTSSSIPFNGFSSTFTMGSTCPAGEIDDTVTAGNKGPGIDVVGVCKHPGFFDGDDHAITLSELTVTNGNTCNGTYRWQQAHDSSNSHAASFWWKTCSLRATGADLLSSLPPS